MIHWVLTFIHSQNHQTKTSSSNQNPNQICKKIPAIGMTDPIATPGPSVLQRICNFFDSSHEKGKKTRTRSSSPLWLWEPLPSVCAYFCFFDSEFCAVGLKAISFRVLRVFFCYHRQLVFARTPCMFNEWIWLGQKSEYDCNGCVEDPHHSKAGKEMP